MQSHTRVFKAALIVLLFISFACEHESPLSSMADQTENNVSETTLKILTFKDHSQSLKKLLNVTEWVSVQEGGYLSQEYNSPMNQCGNSLYVVSEDDPYNIYKLDPNDPQNPELCGNLAFKTGGIAMHPQSGLVYYMAKDKRDDIYRVATWDPQTNTNTILPQGSSIDPAYKLAFHSDGTLYGVNNSERDELMTVNTTTGEATVIGQFNEKFEEKGDLAFGPDGVFYNIFDKHLSIVDLHSSSLIEFAELDAGHLTGLGFNRRGDLYAIKDNGDFFQINLNTGQTTELGDTGIKDPFDMTSFVGDVELAYSSVSLQILPGSIDQDKDVSLNIETTELSGGVAVVFEPHGTIFNPAALLNIEAYGVDFTDIDPSAVDVYYDNPESGHWELMNRESITIDADAGYIRVENAELPHFSRYAIGME